MITIRGLVYHIKISNDLPCASHALIYKLMLRKVISIPIKYYVSPAIFCDPFGILYKVTN